MNKDLEKPDLLKREEGEARYRWRSDDMGTSERVLVKPAALTVAHKERVAREVIATIMGGLNTMKKIIEAMPQYTRRELDAALRYGRNNWIMVPQPQGQRTQWRRIRITARTYIVDIRQ